MRKNRAIGEEESLLNLTPLIDVVFVVLIIFILIAPLLQVDKIALAPGSSAPKENTTAEPGPICIQVREDNSIWMKGRQLSSEQLTFALQQARTQNPTAIPQLFQDKRALFGTYQTVKNAAEAAGFAELDVILQPTNGP